MALAETTEFAETELHIGQASGRKATGRFMTEPTRGPLGAAPRVQKERGLARGIGWFSIGLGLTELIAPGPVSTLIGVKDRPLLFRLIGLREVLSGAAILLGKRPVGGLWSRVAGDALDLSLLGYAATEPTTCTARVAAATAMVAGVTALDAFAAARLTSEMPGMRTIRVVRTLAINAEPAKCYALWRDLGNLPSFMEHVESVEVLDERRSRWVVCGPAGTTVSWDAEIVRDLPDTLIAWRSLEGASVDTAGMVQFLPRPGGAGTLLRVSLVYSPPAGALGAAVARLFGESPEQTVQCDLRRFKQLIETGEVSTTEGQPSGARSKRFKALREFTGGAS